MLNCKNHITSDLSQNLEELKFEKGIWSAAVNGDFERIKKFSKFDMNKPDNYGFTALHYAAHNGHLKICEFLIENQVDINALTKSTLSTPLHRAAYVGNLEIIQLLIKNGANYNLKDVYGKNSLDKAIENDQIEAAEILKFYFK